MNKIGKENFIEVSLAAICEGERYRKDLGPIDELAKSIEMRGLINPISVTAQPDGTYLLVAGGRRLAAMRLLKLDRTIVRLWPTPLDELDLRILELAENLQRKEMTWQETNNLQREIHRLQQAKHGEAIKGSSEKKGWSIEDTAKMLGVSESQVKQSIQLADKMDRYQEALGNPMLYRTENDAKKAIRIIEEARIRAELAKRAEQKNSGHSTFELLSSCYIISDVFAGLASIPSESIDFVECDPPYAISLEEQKKSVDSKMEEYHELSPADYILFNRRLLTEIYRVLKPDTFCFFWFSIDPWLEPLYKLAIEADFTLRRTPAIWIKPNGQSLSPSTSLASCYESALVLKKGQPVLAKPGRSNVFHFSPVPPSEKHHPTQKPLELYQEIYQTFSFEGANCLSPFLGSGAAILAAFLCRRQCKGFDLSEEYKKGFLQQISKLFPSGVESSL